MTGAERDEELARIAAAISRNTQLGESVERFPTGSRPVFATSRGFAIKLFPENEQQDFQIEVTALRKLEDALTIPTPRVQATGRWDGWSFVVMNRLPGRLMAEVWQTFDVPTRRRMVRELGTAIAELHALSTADVPPLTLDWADFCSKQRHSCRARQAAKQLPAAWLEQVDGFLDRFQPQDDGRRALLHTELMREHLLVEPAGDDWVISGLFDFEPAMVGAPEYDFAAVGTFVTGAEPGLFAAFLDAYGAQHDDARPYRVMAYALLHRYSNLRWYLERVGTGGATDLEALARYWFS